MSRRRLPERFFDEALLLNLKAVVSTLLPPAEDVLVCHADAPGWSLVDFNPTARRRASDDGGPLGALAGSSIVEDHQKLADTMLGVTAIIRDSGVFWEWSPCEGLTIYGRIAGKIHWDSLLSEMVRISPIILRLFSN